MLKLLYKVKQKYYELGNNCHARRFWGLRQHEAASAIYQIKNKEGEIITYWKFCAKFYAEVYTFTGKSDQDNIDSCMDMEGLHLPKLSEETLKALDAEISFKKGGKFY